MPCFAAIFASGASSPADDKRGRRQIAILLWAMETRGDKCAVRWTPRGYGGQAPAPPGSSPSGELGWREQRVLAVSLKDDEPDYLGPSVSSSGNSARKL